MVPKIILDTNVLVSTFGSAEGSSRWVLRGALNGRFQPVVSLPLFMEYEDVLKRTEIRARCQLNDTELEDLMDAYASRCEMVELYHAWRPTLRDEGDNHVFELAVATQNATLITWNLRDFASAELRFPRVRVITPAQLKMENA